MAVKISMSEPLQADDFYLALCDQYGWDPNDKQNAVKLRQKGIQNIIEAAWKHGNEVRGRAEAVRKSESKSASDFGNMFGGMFGK